MGCGSPVEPGRPRKKKEGMVKVRIETIAERPTKTGRPRWVVNPGSDEPLTVWNETTAKMLEERVGQEIEAEVREDRFGKKIIRVSPAHAVVEQERQRQTAEQSKEPSQAEPTVAPLKRERLSARQTALNAAVAVATAKVTAGLASPSTDDIKETARQYYRWLTDETE